MRENENEYGREIEVRSLTGESTTVSVSPGKTIQDLKLLLEQTFPPASTSPNFHLFLKGMKSSLQSPIGSHPINSGEFMVFIPFTKRHQQPTQLTDESAIASKVPSQCSASEFADSAWCDMMEDLSSLRNISVHETQPNIELENMNFEDKIDLNPKTTVTHFSKAKYKRGFNNDNQVADDILLSILQSAGGNVPIEQNSDKFIQVLESIKCFSNTLSQKCMFKEAKLWDGKTDPCGSKSSLCSCPSWLKTTMKAFSFLSIYTVIHQLRQEKVTLNCLKVALDQLGKFGLQVGIADLEHLSVLSHKANLITLELRSCMLHF